MENRTIIIVLMVVMSRGSLSEVAHLFDDALDGAYGYLRSRYVDCMMLQLRFGKLIMRYLALLYYLYTLVRGVSVIGRVFRQVSLSALLRGDIHMFKTARQVAEYVTAIEMLLLIVLPEVFAEPRMSICGALIHLNAYMFKQYVDMLLTLLKTYHKDSPTRRLLKTIFIVLLISIPVTCLVKPSIAMLLTAIFLIFLSSICLIPIAYGRYIYSRCSRLLREVERECGPIVKAFSIS